MRLYRELVQLKPQDPLKACSHGHPFGTAKSPRRPDRSGRPVRGVSPAPATTSTLSGYTQSSFSRAFRRQTGQPFVQYVNPERIARSCDLLLHSDRSSIEICFEVDFRNVSNLNRQFLLHRKLTPSTWRRAHRQACAA